MANIKHLYKLHQAISNKEISVWNSFNQDLLKKETVADLQEADLSGYDLSGADLSRADLNDAILKETILTDAKMHKVNLLKAQLSGADMTDAVLEEANIKKTNMNGTILVGANLKMANVFDTCMAGANLKEANFQKATLDKVILYKSNLLRSDFLDTKCSQIIYKKSDFYRHCKKYCEQEKCKERGKKAKYCKETGKKKQKACKYHDLICDGVRTSGMYGDPVFKRFLEDQDYIESFQKSNPLLACLWRKTANYGRSIAKWAIFSIFIILLFSSIFWCLNGKILQFEQTPNAYNKASFNFHDALYFSIITFTTLGFGDIVAANWLTRLFVWIEVVIGYIMLGGLIAIFSNKIARRS